MSDYLTDEEKRLLKELEDLAIDFTQYRQLHEAMVVEMEEQARIIAALKGK